MSAHVGALRTGSGLAAASRQLTELAADRGCAVPGVDCWEATELLTVSSALTAAAAAREETRGCHWREDHPDAADDWRIHLDVRLGAGGRLELARRPVGAPVVQPW
jgi:L-aspartate oxidase